MSTTDSATYPAGATLKQLIIPVRGLVNSPSTQKTTTPLAPVVALQYPEV
jgi:hypothetical protein